MAADDLIDAYLEAFGRRVAQRRDRDDLVAEVADHLYSGSERLIGEGAAPEQAARILLDRFGDPRLVASLITSVPSSGSVRSLLVARALPWTSASAALVWAALIAVSVYGYQYPYFTYVDGVYYSVSGLMATAVLTTTLALVGVHARARGEVGDDALAVGLWGLVAAVLAVSFAWLVPLWTGMLVGIVTFTIVRTRRSSVTSRSLRILVTTGLAIVMAAGVGLWAASLADVFVGRVIWIALGALSAILAAWHLELAIRNRRTAPVSTSSRRRGALA